MDDARYLIRPFADADYDAVSRIWNRVDPGEPVTADLIRHYFHVVQAPGRFQHVLSVEDRRSKEVVATGSVFHAPWAFDPDRYWIWISVDPDHQGRGIGRQLFHDLEGVASSRHAKAVLGGVRAEEPRSVRFFEQSGFVETERVWTSILDLTPPVSTGGAPARQMWASEGVELTTLGKEGAQRPEVRERIYQLCKETSADVPRRGPSSSWTFEQFVETAFAGPGYLPEGVFLARAGDEYVSITRLDKMPAKPDSLYVGYTGTRRSYRGRGIASELKRQAIEFARAGGYHYLQTNNHSLNQPIWAINEKLGFRQHRVLIDGEKVLANPE